jgi:hypothetical protein
MQQSLEKRIAALEEASNTNTERVMFIHLVGMGEVDKDVHRITLGNQEWERLPNESEQDFKDRAKQEAKPTPTGCLTFFCH